MHLRRNGERMTWEDMQLGPSGSPRPDVYTIVKSYARPLPIAYECKISVADFRSDVTTGKWQKYLQFAGAVIFCTPKGLVQKTDVPDGCGLIWYYPETGTFKTVKGPTFRAVVLPQDALLKLLIDGVQRAHAPAREVWQNQYSAMKSIRKRLGDEVADFLRDKESSILRLQRMEEDMKAGQGKLSEINQTCSQREQQAFQRGSERAQSVIDAANGQHAQLCKTLGLSENAGQYEISNAISALRDGLNQSSEVRRLSQLANDVGRIINKYAAHPAATVHSVEVTA